MDQEYPTSVARRSPDVVMRLKRLGSMHQCRLSFMRTLMRRMAEENWKFTRPEFEIDEFGVGHAVYSASGPSGTYSLVAFAHDLPADKRSDRVIAEAWDSTFALFDGTPSSADIERLAKNVPLQEAGRISESELSLSRANRSVRLWSHVVEALSEGRQPDVEKIDAVGYLMRTTAVYGSGKFGAADREVFADRPAMKGPFQAEMLSVFLTRAFVRDLAVHVAKAKGGKKAVDLDPSIALRLGIGNSTGLGMAPFLVNHPVLFNNWIMAKEEAISRVRSVETASAEDVAMFRDLLDRSCASVSVWHSEHPVQIEKLKALKADLELLNTYIASDPLVEHQPWDRLMSWCSDSLTEEGQELAASLILEPYGDLVDGLTDCMSDSNTDSFIIDGSMTVSEVSGLIESAFGWALDVDFDAEDQCARAWYVSEEKLEPRLGERFAEPIADYEQPLAPARDSAAAYGDLKSWEGSRAVAEFLHSHPEHRHVIRRAQKSRFAPYGEIKDNTISSTLMPIDMLRSKLSFFGAIHFDPRSDRWVRICMYWGAPYPDQLTTENADLWVYPDRVSI